MYIQLWDNDYIEHMQTSLAQHVGNYSELLPVSFNWLLLKYTTEHGMWKHMTSQWQPIANRPQTVPFRFRCATVVACEHAKELMKSNKASTDLDVQLSFAYELPKMRKATLAVDSGYLLGFAHVHCIALTEHFDGLQYVYLQRADYYNLVYEVLMERIDTILKADKYIDDEQIISLMVKLLPIFRKNVTSTGDFTAAMWSATYWPESGQRPIRKLRI